MLTLGFQRSGRAAESYGLRLVECGHLRLIAAVRLVAITHVVGHLVPLGVVHHHATVSFAAATYGVENRRRPLLFLLPINSNSTRVLASVHPTTVSFVEAEVSDHES